MQIFLILEAFWLYNNPWITALKTAVWEMAGQDLAQAQDRDQFDFLLKYPFIFTLLYSEDCLALKIQLWHALIVLLWSSYIFNMKAADFSLPFKPFRSILNEFRSKILKGQNSNQVRQRKLLLKKNTSVMVHLCKMLVRTSIFQNYTFRSEINFHIRCWWHRKIL